MPTLTLTPMPGSYAICRLEAGTPLPAWATRGTLWSVTRTVTELSIVCDASVVPAGVLSQGPWRALMVEGPLAFDLTGVLASLASPLSGAGVSLFAVSTYDTDYLLVRDADLERAVATLRGAGHRVGGSQ